MASYQQILQKQDAELLAAVSLEEANRRIESLPGHLDCPWSYGGSGDTFSRHTQIMEDLADRRRLLGLPPAPTTIVGS